MQLVSHRRIAVLWSVLSLLGVGLLGRILLVMAFPNGLLHGPLRWQDDVRTRAALENLDGFVTDDARGQILFRDGEPLTGTYHPGTYHVSHASVPYVHHDERHSPAVGRLMLSGVVGDVGKSDTWPDPTRVVDEQGRTGLEARFDTLLQGTRPGWLGHGSSPESSNSIWSVAPEDGLSVRTTLDHAWQAAAADALQSAGVRRGAVVILRPDTSELLAIASTPTEERTKPVALQSAVPGSVAKLVTAAAAYDSYRYTPTAKFYCRGVSSIPGVHMRCWRTHGPETLTQAIARSCDVALAAVGVRVGRQGLETAWKRQHLDTSQLQSVFGGPVVPEADSGLLFAHEGHDNGLLANTAIGQEDVRMTPLQAANLAGTVARHGLYSDVRLVTDVERDGHMRQVLRGTQTGRAFSPFTAEKLSMGMQGAVLDADGTAHDLAAVAPGLAAKTGTAELSDGRVNAWMIGFYPARQPQIAFCVFVGDTPSRFGHQAVHQIVRDLLQSYRQFPPANDIR